MILQPNRFLYPKAQGSCIQFRTKGTNTTKIPTYQQYRHTQMAPGPHVHWLDFNTALPVAGNRTYYNNLRRSLYSGTAAFWIQCSLDTLPCQVHRSPCFVVQVENVLHVSGIAGSVVRGSVVGGSVVRGSVVGGPVVRRSVVHARGGLLDAGRAALCVEWAGGSNENNSQTHDGRCMVRAKRWL